MFGKTGIPSEVLLKTREISTNYKAPWHPSLYEIAIIYMGYWPSVKDGWIFLRVFMNRDGLEIYNSPKKNEDNVQPSWPKKLRRSHERTYLAFGEIFLVGHCGYSISPAREANHSARFGSSCPAHGANHITKLSKLSAPNIAFLAFWLAKKTPTMSQYSEFYVIWKIVRQVKKFSLCKIVEIKIAGKPGLRIY